MFDVWSKPKFYTKCKPALKHVTTRLEQVKKKRLAVEKFMKTDIADLIKGGLDHEAYLKADMLLVEQNITVCYDLVDQFCGCILDHLSDMVKQRECPEEFREAIASLVYAAARFADLPELRQLRTLFIERYGNSLEPFTNKELVEKLKANPLSKDTKLRSMQAITQEFFIDWDSKALEQKLFTPPQPQQLLPLHNPPQVSIISRSLPTVETNHSSLNDTLHKNKVDLIPERDTPACNELKESRFKIHGKEDNEAVTEPRRFTRTVETNRSSLNDTLHKNKVDLIPKRDIPAGNELKESKFKLDDKEDNEAITEPRRVSRTEQEQNQQQQTSSTSGGYRSIPPPYTRPKPPISEEPRKIVDPEEKKPCSEAPKPRSVRTRRRSLQPGNIGPGDNTNQQGQEDEEERIVDRLLQHYSKKESSEETWRRHRATKSMALGGESSGRSERKVHGRASSVDMGGHVHQNLPEYDGLAARVAALRGT